MSYQSGLEGEGLALDYLKRIGIRILCTRYRGARGEIDVVALEGEELCFIEVKYRPQGRLGEGIDAVTADKRERMRAAALHYMNKGTRRRRYRFDTLEITRAGVCFARNAAVRAERVL